MNANADVVVTSYGTLVAEEKAIRGSLMGSGVADRDIPMLLRLYQDGKLPVDRLKSSTMGFDELNVSLDRLDGGSVVRQMLLPHGGSISRKVAALRTPDA